MENQRNLILAVLLSVIVFVGWSVVANRFFPPTTEVVRGKTVPLPAEAPTPPPAQRTATVRDRATVLRETPRVTIATPRLAGSINLRGARIDDLVLTTHRQTVARDSPPVRLLSPGGTPDAYFAQFGWSGDGVAVPGADTVWTADAAALVPGKPVTLRWDNSRGQRFEIMIAVDENYMFTVRQSVANTAAGAVTVKPYGLVSRVGVSKDPSSWTMHTGPVGAFGGSADYSVDFKDLDKAGAAGTRFQTTGGWIGFGDKYWQTALVPPQDASADLGFRGAGSLYQADYAGAALTVAPGKLAVTQQRFFAGAKEVAVLDAYERGGIVQFDRAIDWGWFIWFEKPIFYLLDWLFHQVGNFGVAIIVLTCIVRGLLFPVAQHQFKSMAAMRKVQPKMKALQEKHKGGDKAVLQKEMMQLYQTEKVNPLAGCLPIFIQMPIFIALYKVLMLSTEMRHQPFTLWIKDLSAPDPLTPVNLFGYLAFTPPPMLHLGVLAILLGVTMWLQMKLNPAATDPMQQQIMMFMPWMMMLFFAPLAAGLQLYYVANNLLSLAQQQFLYARTPGLKESMMTPTK